jgi:hypothetical protein
MPVSAVKYRATITWEGVVEADDEPRAKTEAFVVMETGAGLFDCQVEPLLREVGEE